MSAAFVAVTVHVPAEVALSVNPLTEHPAVPTVRVYVTAPPPEPPLVCRVIVEPNVPVVEVIEILD